MQLITHLKMPIMMAFVLLIFSCTPNEPNPNIKVYFNGDIVTMKGDAPEYIESIVTHNDSIVFTGS